MERALLNDQTMAHLNVRERRLEMKIAYVGPAQSGKATNFRHLGSCAVNDDILSLDWRPSEAPVFRDCNVHVKLVAEKGATTEERVRGLLQDVDGVVFVADADPMARERNRSLLALVRQTLASQGGARPLVVQVNKTDLPHATPAEDLMAALDASTLPHVSAAAGRGDGVVETAERVLADVMRSLQTHGQLDGATTGESLPRVEGNPLLTALRQVLRDTVTQHVNELESRVSANLERLFASFEDHVRKWATPPADAGAFEDLREARQELVRVSAAIGELRDAMTIALRDHSEERASLERQLHDLTVAVKPTDPPQRASAASAPNEATVKLGATVERLERELGEQRNEVRGFFERTEISTAMLRDLMSEFGEEMKRRKWGWLK